MFHGTGLGRGGGGHGGGGHGGGGGGHHGGGGHGGGHHGGGGGGHHGGGHHGGRGRGQTVVVQGGGWGPGWYGGDASYPYAVVEPPCAVVDTNGDCVCQLIDNSGRCMAGLGADEPSPQPTAAASVSTGSSTTWVAGGLIVLLAIGALALEKKGPAPFRRAA